ncbi:MAG TPA: DnaB-like helicase N-terminal domain-containing protein [Salinarimonas sp.]|nr:DnaB-like helicase N-terminal domain-containing protein [Salinarimonas sp.]
MPDPTHYQNIEAERAVLGVILIARKLPETDLDVFDFTLDTHRTIFRAIRSLEHPDPILVVQELNRTGSLKKAGGQVLVDSLQVDGFSVALFAEYVRVLKRCRAWRLRRSAAHRMLDACERADEETWLKAEAWIKGEPTNVIDLASRRAS